MLLLSLAYLTASAEFQPITSVMDSSLIGVQVHTSDGKNHLFLVDSGSNESYVSNSALSEHDRERGDSEVRLDVGAAQVFGSAQAVDPERFSVSIGGNRTEGVLGINVLKFLQLKIDYSSAHLEARFGPALSWAGQGYSTLVMSEDPDHLRVVSARIAGQSIRLCVDTGAGTLVVDPKKVAVDGLSPLPAAEIRSFSGTRTSARYLIPSMQLGDWSRSWMVASTQSWSSSEEGTIGTSQLGGGSVVVDFPGNSIYVRNDDPLGAAASRVLGIPVSVSDGQLRFRKSVPDFFKRLAGHRILALRRLGAEAFVAALKDPSTASSKTIVDAFESMRQMGLITTEGDGKTPELFPIKVSD